MAYVSEDELTQAASKSPRKKGITWDEKTISEHDKERGTRTKIAEVSTPFCYMSDADSQDDSSSCNNELESEDITVEVSNRLYQIEKESEERRRFQELRRRHYSHEYNKQQGVESADEDSDGEYGRDVAAGEENVNYSAFSGGAGRRS
ncbi:protein phosphatase inhibitor 2 [Babesia caballi]|uniref:Protein phosphatase inhibitor 2 n=1 Tax=Babesia caballi TaxID=5871 RepID=A0AAV4LXD6_BABCB|nr:protein phosphatase inhibitor 2 [Babesia caballi]